MRLEKKNMGVEGMQQAGEEKNLKAGFLNPPKLGRERLLTSPTDSHTVFRKVLVVQDTLIFENKYQLTSRVGEETTRK